MKLVKFKWCVFINYPHYIIMESKQKKNSFILIICLLSFLLGMVLSSISFVRQEVGRGLEFMGVRTNLETGYAGV